MPGPRRTPTAETEEHRLLGALALLGLRPGASEAEVRTAYRDRARALHPDRFHHLGPDAVARATPGFRELHGAYRLLLSRVGHGPTARIEGGVYRPHAHGTPSPYAAPRRPGTRIDTAA